MLEDTVLSGQLEYFALVSTRDLRTNDWIERRARDSIGGGRGASLVPCLPRVGIVAERDVDERGQVVLVASAGGARLG